MTTMIPRGALPLLRSDSIFDVMNDFFCDAWMSPSSLIQNNFRMDIKETDANYTIDAELPGVKKDEITLFMEDNYLKISVERSDETEKSEDSYIHRERRHTSMQRSIYLGEASGEGIEASLVDGVLSITVGKKQKDEAQKIEIK